MLDNHDDFGGHAKRNEFTHDGRMLMLNGGTLNIEAPKQYSDVAMGLLRRIGIDIDRFERTTADDRATYQRMGLRNAVFFPKEKFGDDRLVAGTPGAVGAARRLAASSSRRLRCRTLRARTSCASRATTSRTTCRACRTSRKSGSSCR